MTEHIDVTGSGRASAPPDVVRVSAGVRCEAPDVSAALSDAAGRAAALAQAARDHGVDPTLRALSTSAARSSSWEGLGEASTVRAFMRVCS